MEAGRGAGGVPIGRPLLRFCHALSVLLRLKGQWSAKMSSVKRAFRSLANTQGGFADGLLRRRCCARGDMGTCSQDV